MSYFQGMKRLVIIDDEADARENIKHLLALYCPDTQLLAEADSVATGVEVIQQYKPDIVLLDIMMEDGTGFDLLDMVRPIQFHVIFVTAHDDFATKAFDYNAIHYLLKPINPESLRQAIERADTRTSPRYIEQQIKNIVESWSTKRFDKIALPSSEGLIFLKLSEIVRLEADASYTTFFSIQKEKVTVSRNMKDFEELLPKDNFFRTHQSHMVNVHYVKKYLREDGGYALMEDGSKIMIARRRKDEFLSLLTQKLAS